MLAYASLPHNIPLLHQGKTRDTYDIGYDRLLVVASDRISTHNIVHLSTVSRKGEVLTALTVFWLIEVLSDLPHHLIACGQRIYDYLPGERSDYPEDLHLRAIVVKQLEIIPYEFIYRAYLAGSLYDKFYSKGVANPYGIELPAGLPKMFRFEEPIFTPTEKSATDDPVWADNIKRKYSSAYQLVQEVFNRTRAHANSRGVEIIDSKFEIGYGSFSCCIADEVATPDSSRFVLLDQVEEGKDPPWLDKQIARDEAERFWGNGVKEPLLFPPLLTIRLGNVYEDIFRRLTGSNLVDFQDRYLL